jgi:hypothetical protein
VVRGAGDAAGLPDPLRLTRGDLDRGGPALLKFEIHVNDEIRRAALDARVDLAVWLGDDACIALLPAGGLDTARTLPHLEWSAPYHPGLRMAPALLAITDEHPKKRLALTVHLLPSADASATVARLESLGLRAGGFMQGRARSDGRAGRPGRVVLLTSPEAWVRSRATIARWPETLWIDRRPVYRLSNDASAWVAQSGLTGNGSTPVHDHGILGAGQVIGILDTGLDADMCYFRDDTHGLPPVVQGFGVGTPDPDQRKVLVVDFLWSAEDPSDPTDWDTQDHGTHVAGSAAGDDLATVGARDPGDGMAPAAKLVIQDGGYGVDDCADMPAIGCPAADLYPFFEQAYLQGARIHSNSYGDRENFTPYDIYSDGSEAADAFMWDHPQFLLVFAAGNNGPGSGTVASPATAKNVLAVGATEHGTSAGSLAFFSSEGPTHDGRIKPDVTVPGFSVVSADNDRDITSYNCDTQPMSGTSMACPTAAGLAALVREYYDAGYYPSGTATTADGFVPSAALVKATLIASATPMENEASPPPSDSQGWGRLLLDDALYFPGDSKRLVAWDFTRRFSSPSDPADVYPVEVLHGTEPLRVVLAWTDYPSHPAAAVNLVNDLDLEVESPGGVVFLGNHFSGGVSVTGGSPDDRNNVEAVRIENPAPGSWTIRVAPQSVPQPVQGYALVVTGPIPAAGVLLERSSLVLDDSVGGNENGVLEPGEWVDLPLELANSGDTEATNVLARVASVTPGIEIINGTASLPDLPTGAQAWTDGPHPRIRLAAGFPCAGDLVLNFTYLADGYVGFETLSLTTGSQLAFIEEDFEGATAWYHAASESTGSTGDWIVGDPRGTGFQPEDDATPDPGTRCLYTAANPTGQVGVDDVDDGVVVARSGSYDLRGHPEARVRVARWFGNRDVGEDAGDFFRLSIRPDAGSADVPLDELDTSQSAPRWTELTFRVADFVAPGPGVELKVEAADGPATGNIIEGALDEIVFWDPVCEVHDPAPNAVDDLTVERAGHDVLLQWSRPEIDPDHGETERYRIYRSETASLGFAWLGEIVDTSSSLAFTDPGAVLGNPILFYEVIAANPSGDADSLPQAARSPARRP